ncbi:hypothetical protein B296_00017658 [Ensete ventricosum]|uniref:SMP domain-containing protein n=1 Tax=Ensete ventricosum TaxID=4639 RepID=A0A426Z4X3_ENSVE|nr:hypothetical protein B296_00017658 [Ensete ventricosum]
MSQGQPRRTDQGWGEGRDQPIKYGDVFPVAGDLAGQTIAPRDAAMMHSAENKALGRTPKGGPASVMESAASRNEQRGLVGHDQFSPISADQGVSVTQTEIPGRPDQHLVTEFVAGQVRAGPPNLSEGLLRSRDGGVPGGGRGGERGQSLGGVSTWTDKMTIGEALEAAGRAAGDEPIEMSDAAAIEAAESAATGLKTVLRGGIAAAAQSAATLNARIPRDEDKTKLGDVLQVTSIILPQIRPLPFLAEAASELRRTVVLGLNSVHSGYGCQDAAMRLPDDREATRVDAERVVRAEMRNNPDVCPRPGGVADSMVSAARFNQQP